MKITNTRQLTVLGIAIVTLATLACTVPKQAQTRVTTAKVSVDPPFFRRGQTVSVSASLEAPARCNNEYIALRLYDVDDNTGEPSINTSALAQIFSDFDKSTAQGTSVVVHFDALNIPQNSGEQLYMVVWKICPGLKKYIPTTGERLGSAKYKFECGKGPADLCGYRLN